MDRFNTIDSKNGLNVTFDFITDRLYEMDSTGAFSESKLELRNSSDRLTTKFQALGTWK